MGTSNEKIGIASKIKTTWTVIDNPVIDLPAQHYEGEVVEKVSKEDKTERKIKVSGTSVKLTWLVLRRLAYTGSTNTTYTHLSRLTGISKTQLHRVLQVMVKKGWLDVQRQRNVANPKENLPNFYTLLRLPSESIESSLEGTITMDREVEPPRIEGTTTMDREVESPRIEGTTTMDEGSHHHGIHINTKNSSLIINKQQQNGVVVDKLKEFGLTESGIREIIAILDETTILQVIGYAKKNKLGPAWMRSVARDPTKRPPPGTLERYFIPQNETSTIELVEPCLSGDEIARRLAELRKKLSGQ